MNKKIISVFICLLLMGMIPVAAGMSNYDDEQTSPVIEIEVVGNPFPHPTRFGTINIHNIGDADATEVAWGITIDGGFIIFDRYSEGVIPIIPVEEFATTPSRLVLGLGRITITISAECAEGLSDELVLEAMLLGFLIL